MITFRRLFADVGDSGLEYNVWCISVGVLKIKFRLSENQVNALMRAIVTGSEFSVSAKSVYGGIVPVSRANTSGTGKRMMIELDHRVLGCDAEEDTGILQAAKD